MNTVFVAILLEKRGFYLYFFSFVDVLLADCAKLFALPRLLTLKLYAIILLVTSRKFVLMVFVEQLVMILMNPVVSTVVIAKRLAL